MQDVNLSKYQREKLIKLCEELKIKSPEDAVAINNLIQFIRDQKYGLSFEKHQEQIDADLITKIPVFVEDESKRVSLATSPEGPTPYNFLLEGDNLHSLKLLEKTHKGAIDVIYIDPPYNTGNEFRYNDKIIGKDDGYRHSKWLSFMSQRLQIAYKLLSTSGIIFISIDDNEYANLKVLCDSIFGENNVDTMIWRKSGVGRDGKMKNTTTFRKDHEYVIVCFKEVKQLNKIKELPNFSNEYTNADNDQRGPWMSGSLSRSDKASNPNHQNYYTVISPSGKKITRQFEVSKEEFDKLNKDNRISWGKNGDSVPRIKVFINEEREVTPYSMLLTKGTTTEGTKELNTILAGDYTEMRPKPSTLIKALLQIGSKSNSICLDFFAGSGTTGQAVLELNKEDGGNRKFILCTNNEANICEEITYQRLKTIMTGNRADDSAYSDGIPANLKYFKAEMIERNDDDLDEKLLDASIPLIELENFEDIKDTNSSVFIAYSDEDLDDFEAEFDITTNRIKTIYIAEDVCMSESQEQLFEFNEIKVKTIPNNYFREM